MDARRRFEGFRAGLGLVLVALVAACGGTNAPPQQPAMPENRAESMPPEPPGEADVEAAERFDATDTEALAVALDLLDELARASLGAQGECHIAAGRIAGILASSEPVWRRLDEISRDSEREKLLIESQGPIQQRLERFVDALGPCAMDGRVQMSLEGMIFTH